MEVSRFQEKDVLKVTCKDYSLLGLTVRRHGQIDCRLPP